MRIKICNKCDLPKEITEFYPTKSNSDGFQNHCKECHKCKMRIRNKTEPVRAYNRARSAACIPYSMKRKERARIRRNFFKKGSAGTLADQMKFLASEENFHVYKQWLGWK